MATICSMDEASAMVTVRDSESEVKTCKIGDPTGTIQLSLWDSQIDTVQLGKTYTFTNMSTRSFNGQTTLTTTRNTSITQSTSTITLPNTNTNNVQMQTNTLTETIEGSTIAIKKLCPKCHSTQEMNSKDPFHRCSTCKILRKQASYITKCNGSLIFKIGDDELSLAIPNSILTKFLKDKEVTCIDAQDIEEYLLTCGPVTVKYTNDNHVVDIKKALCTSKLPSADTPELDQELCSLTDAISDSTCKQKKPGEKRPAAPENTDAKQTRSSKDITS